MVIDGFDMLIVSLFVEWMCYIEVVVWIKSSRDVVRDEVRKVEVIVHVVKVAVDCGFLLKLAYRFYDMLVEGSIAYEFEWFDVCIVG